MNKQSVHFFCIISSVAFVALGMLVSACEIETDKNIPGVPASGLYAVVAANEHDELEDIQVGVAIFADGEPYNLVGGDIVRATNATDSVLLLDRGYYTGSYAASLPNPAGLDRVDFEIVHEPLEARQRRWYPVERLNIDPGPGELVGSNASVIMPPPPVLSGNLQDTVFVSINDTFNLTWQAGSDEVRVRAAVNCDNGVRTASYGVEVELADASDDGSKTISMNQIIYDLADDSPAVKFIAGEARALLQQLLSRLSAGQAQTLLVDALLPLNPVDSACEIQLFLFRVRPVVPAPVDTDFSGSRSTEVTIYYAPPVTFVSE